MSVTAMSGADDLEALLAHLAGGSTTAQHDGNDDLAALMADLQQSPGFGGKGNDFESLMSNLVGTNVNRPSQQSDLDRLMTDLAENNLHEESQDLEYLMNDLTGGNHVDHDSSFVLAPEDDLESLMNDLSHAQSIPPQRPMAPSQRPLRPTTRTPPADDLESLMNDLAGGNPAPQRAPAQNRPTIPPARAQQAARAAPPPQGDDDLESLMNDLAAKSHQPASQHRGDMDDLEYLMNDLTVSAPQSRQAPSHSHAAPPADDLESLMNDLAGGRPAPQQQRAQPPRGHAPPQDDLEALMNDLTGGHEQPQENDLESLMSELSAPQQHNQGSFTPPMSEVDRLMNDLGGSGGTPNLDVMVNNFGGRGQMGMSGMNPMMGNQMGMQGNMMGNQMGMGGYNPMMGNQMGMQGMGMQGMGMGMQGNPMMSNQMGMGMQGNQMGGRPSDLDNLMKDFSMGGNSTPSSSELNSLMNNRQSMMNFQQSSPVGGASSSSDLEAMLQNMQATPKPQSSDNGLNDLMNELNSVPIRGAPSGASGHQDLDQMLNGLSGKSSVAATPPAKSSPAPKRGEAARNKQAQQRPSAVPSGNGQTGASDLDAIMQGLVDKPSVPAAKDIKPKINSRPTESLPRGMCSGCRKYITGEITTALGRTYHPEHFVCGTCETVIGGGNFFEKDGQPQCNKCYQSHYCPKCARCDKPISTQMVNALGRKWHVNCFVCTKCLIPFQNGQFYDHETRPYCQGCFKKVSLQMCKGCGQMIQGSPLEAMGAVWHPDHFVCQICKVGFPDGRYYQHQGLPICPTHYQQVNQGGSMMGNMGGMQAGNNMMGMGGFGTNNMGMQGMQGMQGMGMGMGGMGMGGFGTNNMMMQGGGMGGGMGGFGTNNMMGNNMNGMGTNNMMGNMGR